MTTRAKLNIASLTASTMMMLNVFSKPLGIPQAVQWVLILGAFAPLALVFRYLKILKQEKAMASQKQPQPEEDVKSERNKAKNRVMIGVAMGLAAPLWMPFTGSSLNNTGNLFCGLVTAVIVCIICGIQIRKL